MPPGPSGARSPTRSPKLPKLAALLDEAEEDVLAYMAFPKEHRAKIHSTNPLERLNGEIKRRTEVVGIFPNEAAITRLVGAILLEQNDEWAVQRARYMTLETIAPLRDDLTLMLPAGPMNQSGPTRHGDPGRPTATPRPGTRPTRTVPSTSFEPSAKVRRTACVPSSA